MDTSLSHGPLRSLSAPGPVRLALAALILVSGAARDVAAQCPVETILAADTEVAHRFGQRLAVDGSDLWIGAPSWSPSGSSIARGRVYHYDLDGTLIETLGIAGGQSGDNFGDALAADGDQVLVGARGADRPGANNAGSAYVFEWDGAAWTSIELVPSSIVGLEQYGSDVALEGDVAAVANGQLTPRVVVWERQAGIWTEVAALALPAGTESAPSVRLDGGQLFVGARDGAGMGEVLVYEDTGGGWAPVDSLTPSAGDPGNFGAHIALDGDVLVVGAAVELGFDARLEVFRRSGGSWSLEDVIENPAEPLESFGTALAVLGDRLLVGASRRPAFTERGVIYLYEHDGAGSWELQGQIASLTSIEDARFGVAVALTPDRLVAGASSLGTETIPTPVQLFDDSDVSALSPWTILGSALAGQAGEPRLRPYGMLCEGSGPMLELDAVRPLTQMWIVLGLSDLSAAFKGGTLVPFPDILVGPFPTDSDPSFELDFTLTGAIPGGIPLWLQSWIVDDEGPVGFAATNAITGTTTGP